MKNTLFINLVGGPGTGKSVLCASLFAELKIKQYDCEMALEYAKDVVWEESFKKLKNQIYIFGKQHSRIHRLNGKVDIVITDSPLLNSIIYDLDNNKYLKDLILHEYSKLNSVTIFLNRATEYNPNGRMQTMAQALEVDEKYRKLLNEEGISYLELTTGQYNLDNVVNDIIDVFNQRNN